MSRVTPELRAAVFARDKRCVLFDLDPTHVCRDVWGQVHMPTATHLLTVEHVKSDLRMGVRAPSDMEHLVAMCGYSNVAVPSKDQRQRIREYLERVNLPEAENRAIWGDR
jgi:hypothetical protein